MSEIKQRIKKQYENLNYAQLLEVTQSLIKDGEFELRKNWLEARTEIKFKDEETFRDLNFLVIRGIFTEKYNILVSKNDFKEVLEYIAELLTPKEESDDWYFIAKEWLNSNNNQEITSKELGNKCFQLSIKELNPKTLQRLSKILRCCGYSKNTKTSVWSKSSPTVLPTDLKTNDSKDSSVGVSQSYSILPTPTNEDYKELKKLRYENKELEVELKKYQELYLKANQDKIMAEKENKNLKEEIKKLKTKLNLEETLILKVREDISPFDEEVEEEIVNVPEPIKVETKEVEKTNTFAVPSMFPKKSMFEKVDMFSGQPINNDDNDDEEIAEFNECTGDEY